MTDYGRRVKIFNSPIHINEQKYSVSKFLKWVGESDCLIELGSGYVVKERYDFIQFLDAPESPKGGEG